jgi:hypothetical protein
MKYAAGQHHLTLLISEQDLIGACSVIDQKL